ncbi:hypothetical protein BC936DRAFT_140009 [Jimgerdemannia flammicorona]|uniref:Uncharacterized protein n=1 Tax=Jimgerdemannia flammicorona TaxID=994334 RepID=A0A433B6P1_9FUNG|nr:hypothetical protein BC936DRAFT_140009 [Jimgerdemannia flammicorona]
MDNYSISWVRKHIVKLRPDAFYGKFGYSYISRKIAEDDLKCALKTIEQEGNRSRRTKARSLLNRFEAWTHSLDCENYWLKLEIMMDKAAHDVAGRKAAYRSLDIYCQKVNTEERDSSPSSSSTVQAKVMPNLLNIRADNGYEGSSGDEEEGDEARADDEDESITMSSDEEKEDNKVDIGDLDEASVAGGGRGRAMTELDWAAARATLDKYRSKLPKTRRLYDPLFYFIIDHSGHHGPTSKILGSYFCSMLASLPDALHFVLPKLSDEQNKYFDKLITASDLDDVTATTFDERRAKNLVRKVMESVTLHSRDDMSEFEHLMRNLVPLLDATVGQVQDHRVHYGEHTLQATAVRRNKDSNPAQRARTGYKVDVLVEFLDLDWRPDISCGEVSGGLPRCSRAKEWRDTLKLGWELRDMWAMVQDELFSVDASGLVIWGFTTVGKLYSLSYLQSCEFFTSLMLTMRSDGIKDGNYAYTRLRPPAVFFISSWPTRRRWHRHVGTCVISRSLTAPCWGSSRSSSRRRASYAT